jgi:trigger factor
VKTSVEPLEGNKVKVSVEVDETEFDKALDAAFKKIAREVRIPGFRPGKVPRRVLEARIGSEAGRTQALQDSLPEFYLDAVREHDVDVIAAPEIEITDGEEAGPVAFEAVVEVRPVIQVPGYGSLRVTIPSPEPSDEDIDEQIERLQSQFAELETVDREAVEGDVVTIDISGSQDDEPIAQLSAEDYSYEVGSDVLAAFPVIDERLRGATAGSVLTFSAPFPGTEPRADTDDEDDEADDEAGADVADEDDDRPSDIDFEITVKEVKQKVLPELNDEFASDASEFDSLGDLRDSLRTRMANVKRMQAQMAMREKTGEALAELVDEEMPEALVNSEVSERLNDLAMRLQAQGMDLDTWVAQSGRSAEDIVAELRETAQQAVKVDLALRAVVEAEAIECTDEDLEQEFAQVAERMNLKAKDVRKQFERAQQVPAVRSDVKKRKAFDWLLERVEIVDEEGRTIDRSALEFETAPADEDVEEPVSELDGDTDEAEASAAEGAETGSDDTDDSEDDE